MDNMGVSGGPYQAAVYTDAQVRRMCHLQFIVALLPLKHLITSNHSPGLVRGALESHAQVCECWLCRHLKQGGKDDRAARKDTIYEEQDHRNGGASRAFTNPILPNTHSPPQLCDDDFEEHILPCSAYKTGLHHHGINDSDCMRDFLAQPPAVLDTFEREWGFMPTLSLYLPSVQDVRTFTDEVGRSRTWNGEPLEGFIVSATVRSSKPLEAPPPRADGSSFFFKVKFDESFMMYRDWREIKKAILARGEGAKLPKSNIARAEAKVYVKWVREEIKEHAKLFDGYTKGHRIIATHERFFK
ncbi:RNA ligase-domain-containing protein [Lactarius quietus]|nr:RNA ligase-domain-containing protein [Lactarius quietus]